MKCTAPMFFHAHLYLLLLMHQTVDAQLNPPLVVPLQDPVLSIDTTVVMRPDASYQKYYFHVLISSANSSSLVISRSHHMGHRSLADTLNVIDIHPDDSWQYAYSNTLLQFVDINIDGFDDLFVLREGGDHLVGFEYYDIWLFNPFDGRFHFSQVYTDSVNTNNFDMDETRKTFVCRYYNFYNPFEYWFRTYRTDKDTLFLIGTESRVLNDDGPDGRRVYTWKREKLVRGVLKVVRQRLIPQEELEKQEER